MQFNARKAIFSGVLTLGPQTFHLFHECFDVVKHHLETAVTIHDGLEMLPEDVRQGMLTHPALIAGVVVVVLAVVVVFRLPTVCPNRSRDHSHHHHQRYRHRVPLSLLRIRRARRGGLH